MNGQSKDYYRVLGVSEKADAQAIRKAYRKLAKQYHPDANQGDPGASERFKEVGEAYGVLSNEEKRKQYDRMRKLGAFGMGGVAGGRVDRGPAPPGEAPRAANPSPSTISADGGAGRPLLDALRPRGTAGAGRGRSDPAPSRGRCRGAGGGLVRAGREGREDPAARAHDRTLRDLQRERGRAGLETRPVRGVPGLGHRVVRPGWLRREPTLSGLHGPGPDPRDALCVVRRVRVGPPDAEAPGHGARRGRNGIPTAAGRAGGARLRRRGAGRPDPRLPGEGAPVLPAGRARHPRDRALNLAQAVLGSKVRVRTVGGKQVVLRIPRERSRAPGSASGARA
jgi:molecular chaperone DnaJ